MTLSNMNARNELDAPLHSSFINCLNSDFEISFDMDVEMVAEMTATLPPETT